MVLYRVSPISISLDVPRSSLATAICHFPPRTSKWNNIEQCMSSFISFTLSFEDMFPAKYFSYTTESLYILKI